ncbi:MAG: hypothetical protein ACTSR8_02740 [Promethearchaeota archaeon]
MSGIRDFKKWPMSCKAGTLVIIIYTNSIILYRYEDPKAEIPFKGGGLIAFAITILILSFIMYYGIFSAGPLLERVIVFFSLGFVGLLIYYGRYISNT